MTDSISPSPPSSLIAHTLRTGTFNVGCGFLRKLPHLLRRCITLSLDVVAVQEIGDPAITSSLSSSFSPYFFIFSSGPSNHEAGVGLLISQALAPCCRAYKRSNCGRLIGVVLELIKGQQLLILSAYMPAGLDHCSNSHAKVEQAQALYNNIVQWSVGMHQVIVMGDLNETLTAADRFAHLQQTPSSSPLLLSNLSTRSNKNALSMCIVTYIPTQTTIQALHTSFTANTK